MHAILRRRAASAGQSLQTYLLLRLTRDARDASLEEVLDRAAARAGGSAPFASATDTIRSERGQA